MREGFEFRQWYYNMRKPVKKRVKKKKVQMEENVTEEEQVQQLIMQNGPTHTYDFTGRPIKIQAVNDEMLPTNLNRSKYFIKNQKLGGKRRHS